MCNDCCSPEPLPDGSWKCPICNYAWTAERGPTVRKCSASTSRGLGDTFAKVTHALGIPKCGGCEDRQEWFNEFVPFRKSDQPQAEGQEAERHERGAGPGLEATDSLPAAGRSKKDAAADQDCRPGTH